LTIARGRIIIYRLFDAAQEIDLARIEEGAREGARRLKFSRYPYMKALELSNPPLSFELAHFTKALFGGEIKVGVIAKAYDFGVISIAFEIPVPGGATFEELEAVTRELDEDRTIDALAREHALQLMESLGASVVSPEIKEDFVEDYAVFYVEELGGGMSARDLPGAYDASRLLLYEPRELSAFTKEETLRHSFSYYPEDLVILHVDNALIIDPSGSSDLPDILEFANAQILELRYYDRVIDNELKWFYAELASRRGVSLFRLREYERLARKITRTVTDITEVTERVHNSLKVTEDIYYARIYRTMMAILRSDDWEDSTREKLRIVMNTYEMLHDEITIKRGYAVELGILMLIAIDIALVVLGN
jgi:hypothetical protein